MLLLATVVALFSAAAATQDQSFIRQRDDIEALCAYVTMAEKK
jgi:hypothetical protein